MFLRIKIQDVKDFKHCMWLNRNTNIEPEIWRLMSIAFESTSSPFQAISLLMKHAEMHQTQFPLAMKENTYMDYTSDGALTKERAKDMLEQIVALLMEASMMPH